MNRPNVIWITVESTRADHTFLGDYDRVLSTVIQTTLGRFIAIVGSTESTF